MMKFNEPSAAVHRRMKLATATVKKASPKKVLSRADLQDIIDAFCEVGRKIRMGEPFTAARSGGTSNGSNRPKRTSNGNANRVPTKRADERSGGSKTTDKRGGGVSKYKRHYFKGISHIK